MILGQNQLCIMFTSNINLQIKADRDIALFWS